MQVQDKSLIDLVSDFEKDFSEKTELIEKNNGFILSINNKEKDDLAKENTTYLSRKNEITEYRKKYITYISQVYSKYDEFINRNIDRLKSDFKSNFGVYSKESDRAFYNMKQTEKEFKKIENTLPANRFFHKDVFMNKTFLKYTFSTMKEAEGPYRKFLIGVKNLLILPLFIILILQILAGFLIDRPISVIFIICFFLLLILFLYLRFLNQFTDYTRYGRKRLDDSKLKYEEAQKEYNYHLNKFENFKMVHKEYVRNWDANNPEYVLSHLDFTGQQKDNMMKEAIDIMNKNWQPDLKKFPEFNYRFLV